MKLKVTSAVGDGFDQPLNCLVSVKSSGPTLDFKEVSLSQITSEKLADRLNKSMFVSPKSLAASVNTQTFPFRGGRVRTGEGFCLGYLLSTQQKHFI